MVMWNPRQGFQRQHLLAWQGDGVRTVTKHAKHRLSNGAGRLKLETVGVVGRYAAAGIWIDPAHEFTEPKSRVEGATHSQQWQADY